MLRKGTVVEMRKQGVDLSEMNGALPLQGMKGEVDFILLRAGYGSDYKSQDDTQFYNFVAQCNELSIPWGAYLYSYALNVKDAQSEAAHMLRLIDGFYPSYGVWLDMEDGDGYKAQNGMPSDEILTDICVTFCDALETAGYYTGIYSNLSWLTSKLSSPKLDRFDKWVAQWNTTNDYKGSYGIWQYTSTGRIPGYSGRFDLNYAYRDYPKLTNNGRPDPAPDPGADNYPTGTYEVTATVLNVRTGPGTDYPWKRFEELTENARQQIMALAGYAANGYVRGMTFDVMETKGAWGRTPSGWVSLDWAAKI